MKTNILIAWYSWSGNTEKLAGFIRKATGGTLHRIVPVKPYPRSYNEAVDQAKSETESGFHPELESYLPDIAAWDTIFIGSPLWWYTIAPPVASFLSSYSFAGKQ
ncbi:MAG: flavodoxin, partial [Spirochaetales bacterium]|nr:flavodoxin [Spirochaetales bacterium]